MDNWELLEFRTARPVSGDNGPFYGVQVVDTGCIECTYPFFRIAPESRLDLPPQCVVTCLDVDKMNKGATQKAYTSYIGPLRKGDHKSGSVVKLREALKRAIIPRAETD